MLIIHIWVYCEHLTLLRSFYTLYNTNHGPYTIVFNKSLELSLVLLVLLHWKKIKPPQVVWIYPASDIHPEFDRSQS